MSNRSSVASTGDIEHEIGGMTCASCAARIEKRLNKLDGVVATVNYATEKARVSFPDGVELANLVAEVEKAGYTAALPVVKTDDPELKQPSDQGRDLAALRTRLIVSAILSVPVVILAMVPAWQFTNWQWLSLALAAPVVVWGGLPFHQAAWKNLRHGAATMDTLISVGTIAAFLWSLYALFFGTAGMPGMTHGFEFTLARSDGGSNLYLEVAAAVTVFVLVGRYFDKRSKRQAGAALRALLDLGAKDVAMLRAGQEVRIPAENLQIGDTFVVRPGRRSQRTA